VNAVWWYIYESARIALVAAFVIGAMAGWVLLVDPKPPAKKIVTWMQVGSAAMCVLAAGIIVYTGIFTGL
jgi:hypothetical protein